MTRLTYKNGRGKPVVMIDGREHGGPVADRLAAYEDTGLDPETIEKASIVILSAFDLAVKHDGKKTLEHLKRIICADADARLLVLPCKTTATCKHAVGGIYLNPIGEACMLCEIYDGQRNISLGECIGNCESEEAWL